MICMVSHTDDPFLNLALEEYLLRNGTGEIFLLWQSRPAVVVGKHQNTLAELNFPYVRENRIIVARRLSGGGTVFHGPGNLNFTFIRNGEPGKLVDFSRFIRPVTGYLATLGIEAVQGPRNEIIANGKKISGNAEHVFRNRVLHHGTLLFEADLGVLRESIRVTPGRYIDKAVQSNRSSVINIAECLSIPMSLEAFRDGLLDYVSRMEDGEIGDAAGIDWETVRQLAVSKYNTWEWIYGWSPDYQYHLDEKGPVNGSLSVHRGMISAVGLRSAEIPEGMVTKLEQHLTGCRHAFEDIEQEINAIIPPGYGKGSELANLFF